MLIVLLFVSETSFFFHENMSRDKNFFSFSIWLKKNGKWNEVDQTKQQTKQLTFYQGEDDSRNESEDRERESWGKRGWGMGETERGKGGREVNHMCCIFYSSTEELKEELVGEGWGFSSGVDGGREGGVLININNKWDIQGLSLGSRRRGWEIIFILKKSKIRHFQRVFNCAGPYPYFSEKKREKKMFWELDRKDGTSWSREVKFYWAFFETCGEVPCT